MTRTQLTIAISRLLYHAEKSVTAARECGDRFEDNSWIVHMTTSHVCSALAEVLMTIRSVEQDQEAPHDQTLNS